MQFAVQWQDLLSALQMLNRYGVQTRHLCSAAAQHACYANSLWRVDCITQDHTLHNAIICRVLMLAVW